MHVQCHPSQDNQVIQPQRHVYPIYWLRCAEMATSPEKSCFPCLRKRYAYPSWNPVILFLTATQTGDASDGLGNGTLKIGLEHFTRGGLKRTREDDGVVGSENNSFSRCVGADSGETVELPTNACHSYVLSCNKVICLPDSSEASSQSVEQRGKADQRM